MVYSPLVDEQMPPTGRYKDGPKWSARPVGVKINGLNVHHHATTNDSGIRRLIESNDPASANYIIRNNGSLIGSVPEEYRAWTTSSYANDDDKITVEIQNETGAPEWRISDKAMATLVALYSDLARRYGFTPDRAHIKGHQEYGVATACPGPYLLPRLDQVARDAQAAGVKPVVPPKPTTTKETSVTRTPAQAVAWAKPVRKGYGGLCLQFTRLAYSVPAKYPSAISAWNNAAHKHRTTSTSGVPLGAPIYFTKPGHKYGHIAVYVGGGKMATTHSSTNRTGVDRVSLWTGSYGWRMLGWTEDVNGVRVIPEGKPASRDGDRKPVSGKKRKPHRIGTVRLGNRSWRVKLLQNALNERGYKVGKADGVFGNKTLAGLKSFQRATKGDLTVDGICGPKTWYRFTWGARYGQGNTARVRIAKRVAGYTGVSVPGGFGPKTRARWKEIQRWLGVSADGVIGPKTTAALLRKG